MIDEHKTVGEISKELNIHVKSVMDSKDMYEQVKMQKAVEAVRRNGYRQ